MHSKGLWYVGNPGQEFFMHILKLQSSCALQMLEDHLSEKALIPALRFVAENHPQRLAQSETKQMQKAQDARQFQKNVKDTVPANGAATTGEKTAVDAVT